MRHGWIGGLALTMAALLVIGTGAALVVRVVGVKGRPQEVVVAEDVAGEEAKSGGGESGMSQGQGEASGATEAMAALELPMFDVFSDEVPTGTLDGEPMQIGPLKISVELLGGAFRTFSENPNALKDYYARLHVRIHNADPNHYLKLDPRAHFWVADNNSAGPTGKRSLAINWNHVASADYPLFLPDWEYISMQIGIQGNSWCCTTLADFRELTGPVWPYWEPKLVSWPKRVEPGQTAEGDIFYYDALIGINGDPKRQLYLYFGNMFSREAWVRFSLGSGVELYNRLVAMDPGNHYQYGAFGPRGEISYRPAIRR